MFASAALAQVALEFPGLPRSGWYGGDRKERAAWILKLRNYFFLEFLCSMFKAQLTADKRETLTGPGLPELRFVWKLTG